MLTCQESGHQVSSRFNKWREKKWNDDWKFQFLFHVFVLTVFQSFPLLWPALFSPWHVVGRFIKAVILTGFLYLDKDYKQRWRTVCADSWESIGLHLLNAFLLIRCVTSILLSFTLLHRVANRQTKGYVRSRKATDRHSVSEQTNDQVIGRRIYRFIYTFRISQSRTKLDDDDQE